MGNLTTSPTTVSWSASQQGMRISSPFGGVRAQSLLLSSQLLSHLGSDFTLEFFFNSPGNEQSQFLLIAGFGTWASGAPYMPCDATNVTAEGGWRLYSGLASSIVFDGVVFVNGVPTCRSLRLSIVVNSLRHLVVRCRNGFLSMVSHGSSTSNSDPSIQFSSDLWDRHPSPLVIANPHPSAGWTGTLYMIAMYDRFMPNTEIASNFEIGPPNSLPITLDAFAVLEDGTATLYP